MLEDKEIERMQGSHFCCTSIVGQDEVGQGEQDSNRMHLDAQVIMA